MILSIFPIQEAFASGGSFPNEHNGPLVLVAFVIVAFVVLWLSKRGGSPPKRRNPRG